MNTASRRFVADSVRIGVYLGLLFTLTACRPAQPSPAAPTAVTPAASLAPATARSRPTVLSPTETLPLAAASATPVFAPPSPTPANPEPTAGAPTPAQAGGPPPNLDCANGLRYLSDLTIPDGTQVIPGAQIDKRWQVENSGACNWDERYRLRLISGDALGAPAEQALYPARGGAQAVIRLLLIAPTEPGTYRSVWQAIDPQGQPFGDPITIEILVAASAP